MRWNAVVVGQQEVRLDAAAFIGKLDAVAEHRRTVRRRIEQQVHVAEVVPQRRLGVAQELGGCFCQPALAFYRLPFPL